jgi:hypothetical protein
VAGSPSDDVKALVILFRVQPFLRALAETQPYATPSRSTLWNEC